MPYKDEQKQREYKEQFRKNTLRQMQELKESTPCMDCGNKFPHYIMEFDHVRGEKLFNVTANIGGRKFQNKRIQEEIAKCDLVCANCHCARTYFRRISLSGKAVVL